MLEAHYTNGSKTQRATLAIARTVNGRREWLDRMAVFSKPEARKIAAELGAQPWNF